MTQQIIVDSCGWVAIIDSKINFEAELERIFGNFTLMLTESVCNELTDIDASRSRKNSLLMDLLKHKSAPIQSKLVGHTDDHIFELAESGNYAVLTIDKVLKMLLYQRGIEVVEVDKNQHLRLIEGL